MSPKCVHFRWHRTCEARRHAANCKSAGGGRDDVARGPRGLQRLRELGGGAQDSHRVGGRGWPGGLWLLARCEHPGQWVRRGERRGRPGRPGPPARAGGRELVRGPDLHGPLRLDRQPVQRARGLRRRHLAGGAHGRGGRRAHLHGGRAGLGRRRHRAERAVEGRDVPARLRRRAPEPDVRGARGRHERLGGLARRPLRRRLDRRAPRPRRPEDEGLPGGDDPRPAGARRCGRNHHAGRRLSPRLVRLRR
jgi:hypothetical protein